MATIQHPENNNVARGQCAASFDAEVQTRTSQSYFDKPVVDAKGQGPTWADHLTLLGVALTAKQWAALAALPTPLAANPEWEPTYEQVVLNEPYELRFAICPTCGSPIQVD